MQLWQRKKISKTVFLHNPEGELPPKHKCIRAIVIMTFQTRSNTITLFIVKSVAAVAPDLTTNYANFSPLNVWNFAPLHVCIMLR